MLGRALRSAENKVRNAMRVTVAKEIGKWTIRLDGEFVDDYWSRAKAYEVAFRLMTILETK